MKRQATEGLAGWRLDAGDFLAVVLQSVAQPVWVIDHDGKVLFANPASLRTLGYESLDELRGKPSHDTIHYRYPDGRPFPASECQILRPRITGETVRSDEDWFFRRDGEMFPVSYVASPIETPTGRGAVVAFSDIGERRVAEEDRRQRQALEVRNAELLASELRYRAILEAAFDAIISVDHELHVTYMNSAAVRTFGYAPQEAVGRDLITLVGPPHLRERYRAWWERRQREDREVLTRSEDALAMRADGREFPVEFAVARMAGIVGYTTYYRDLTDRIRTEGELRDARRRLVRAAHEERRRIARDLHDGAQQQFVNLALSLELAARSLKLDPDGALESLRHAREEARAGTLALRELVAGIHPAVLTSRGLADAIRSLAGRTPLEVRHDELHEVRVDPAAEAAAYFVVSEALTNVVKHAGASRAVVRTVVADGQLHVSVDDDGCGGADPGVGTGLAGLADRVAALDGTLRVVSEPGRGTSVSCRLPLARDAGD
ncbi:MAG TPA: PAS domain S-box protein [Solirubrobacteraceae bacterium]|nr:PAS domain S-box protein [Solirubrobacteraceae bacterium]